MHEYTMHEVPPSAIPAWTLASEYFFPAPVRVICSRCQWPGPPITEELPDNNGRRPGHLVQSKQLSPPLL